MSELRARGLGRGLSALLGDSPAEVAAQQAPAGGVREIDVGAIRPNPKQPRRHFPEEAMAELTDSIASRGVIQPILVRQTAAGRFEIVAGERRWRAAQRAELLRIPAIVREFDQAGTAEIALIENVQRADLNALEEANAYAALISDHGHKPDEVGKLVGKSRSHVANLLRLRDLPASVQDHVASGALSMGHARAIAAAPDPSGLAEQIVNDGLSVRQAEALARQERTRPAGKRGKAPTSGMDADLAALERQLGDLLGIRVKVTHANGSGTVSPAYATLDLLDLICQRLSGEAI